MIEILADGFTSYVDPPMDEKSIVMLSLVGVYCLNIQNNNYDTQLTQAN